MLARSKLISIETVISQTLIDLENSNEEYKPTMNEEENYKRQKN